MIRSVHRSKRAGCIQLAGKDPGTRPIAVTGKNDLENALRQIVAGLRSGLLQIIGTLLQTLDEEGAASIGVDLNAGSGNVGGIVEAGCILGQLNFSFHIVIAVQAELSSSQSVSVHVLLLQLDRIGIDAGGHGIRYLFSRVGSQLIGQGCRVLTHIGRRTCCGIQSGIGVDGVLLQPRVILDVKDGLGQACCGVFQQIIIEVQNDFLFSTGIGSDVGGGGLECRVQILAGKCAGARIIPPMDRNSGEIVRGQRRVFQRILDGQRGEVGITCVIGDPNLDDEVHAVISTHAGAGGGLIMDAGNEVRRIVAHLLDDHGSGLGFHSDRIGLGGKLSAACVDLNGMIAHNADKHSHRRIDQAVRRRGARQHQVKARRKVNKLGEIFSRRNGARHLACRGKVIPLGICLERFGVLSKIVLQVGGRQLGEPVVQRLAGSTLFPFKKSLERGVVFKAAIIVFVLDHAIGRDGIARLYAFKGNVGVRHRGGGRKSGGRQADGQHKRQKECAEFSQMLFHSVLPFFFCILTLFPKIV